MSKLTLEPAEKITFKGPFDTGAVVSVLKITNGSGKRMSYKVKCTSNELFKIRPVMGILEEGQAATVVLTFNAKGKLAPTANHHFTVTETEPKDDEKNARKVWEGEEAKKLPAAKKIKAEFIAGEAAAATGEDKKPAPAAAEENKPDEPAPDKKAEGSGEEKKAEEPAAKEEEKKE